MTFPRRSRSQEQGLALVWAILLMLVVAGLSVAFSLVATRAGERSNDAARRVTNSATIQTAVTRVLYGFQNDYGSEQDYYTFDAADLDAILRSSGALAAVRRVDQLPRLPADFRQTYGVWEHEAEPGRPHRLVPTGVRVPNDVVEERFQADPRACDLAGVPRASCSPGQVAAYWQVVRVVMPDITGNDSPSVAVTLRSWLGVRSSGQYSKASYARVEMRPGRFADFQLIADGNMNFGPGAVIDGPVHSNGLDDGSFSTVHRAPEIDRNINSWTWLSPGVRCERQASITMRVGQVLPGAMARACNSQGATGQTISFMRALDSITTIEESAARGRAGVGWFRAGAGQRGRESGRDPYETAWTVRLDGRTMHVTRPDGVRRPDVPLRRVNAFAFDEDVRVSGFVAADTRVTIAAQREGGASATIYIDGNITKGDDQSTSIGLISQGDVVIWQTDADSCRVTRVQAGIVAATGGVTIPTRHTTDEVQSDAPSCARTISLDGSIAGHRPPTLVWTWRDANTNRTYYAGYRGERRYTWDEQLKRNPPPFFPLTGTWQPFNVRAGNADCLLDRARLADPRCR